MHDLIPIDAIPPGALTVAEIYATMGYAQAEKATSTERRGNDTGCGRLIVKKLCARIGLDAAAYAGHSMRSGFVTAAVEANAPIMENRRDDPSQKPGNAQDLQSPG